MAQNQNYLPPWIIGPYELIRHADDHYLLGNDFDRLIAFIGFDDSIEVSIDSFLNLHPKTRGGVEILNNDVEKARKNYIAKLEFFFNYVNESNIQVEVKLEDIIWYHQLRNQLYHSGNGFTPDIHALKGIRASSYAIFKALFLFDISSISNTVEKIRNYQILTKILGNNTDFSQSASKPRNDAELIRNVLKHQGHILLMINPRGDPLKFYRFCEIPNVLEERYGVQINIYKKDERKILEITSYRLMEETLEDVRKHFVQRGCIEVNDFP